MGIHGLYGLLKELAPATITHTKYPSNYRNKIVAVDALMVIYEFLKRSGKILTHDKTPTGEVTNHILGVLERVTCFIKCGITPIFVFDGFDKVAKAPVIAERRKDVEAAKKERDDYAEQLKAKGIDVHHAHAAAKKERNDHAEILKARGIDVHDAPEGVSSLRKRSRDVDENKSDKSTEESLEKYDLLVKRAMCISSNDIKDTKTLLTLLGIQYYDAISDAEACCVKLLQEEIVDAVASGDTDCLPFGCSKMLPNFNVKALSNTKDRTVTEVSVNEILEALTLSKSEFVDLCILLGCDYCAKIEDKCKAMEGSESREIVFYNLIKKHHTIEKVLAVIDRTRFEVPKILDYKVARQVYQNNINIPKFVVEMKNPQYHELESFLLAKGFKVERRIKLLKDARGLLMQQNSLMKNLIIKKSRDS